VLGVALGALPGVMNMKEDIWYFLFGIAALVTLGWGLYTIGKVSLMCWRRRSTRSFFSDIWGSMQGLWVIIIPLMVASVPVFVVLSVIVALAGKPSVLQSGQHSFRIARNGQDLGELPVSTIKQMIASGQLSMQDYYFDTGANDWKSLDCLAAVV